MLKPGYIKTDAGIIPEDWKAHNLGSVIQLQRGFDLPHRMRRAGNIPIISSSGHTDTHNKALVSAPGVVTGRYGTIGEVFYVEQDFWPLNTTLYVKDFKGNNPLYISYLLKTIDFASHSGKSGVPGVNRNDLHELFVAMPSSTSEQQAIAQILGAVDALLTEQRALLAKKRDLKYATQTALLTRAQRLPGFTGEWQEKTLGDVVQIKKGTLITEKTHTPGQVPVIAGGQTPAYFHNKANRPGPTITVSASGAYAGFVAFHDYPIFASDCSTIEKGAGYNLHFIYFFLKSKQKEIYEAQTGGAQPHIHVKDIAPLQLLLPSPEEQQAVVQTLASMDAEIEALATQLAKTEALKKGLMQDLLTGTIRLTSAAQLPPQV
jgi:type I restriction enzyme S subunit